MITKNASSVNKLRRFDSDVLGISIPPDYSGIEKYDSIIKTKTKTKVKTKTKNNKKP